MSLQGKTTSGICRLSLANIKQGDFAALPPADPATAASASADPGETPSASPPSEVCLPGLLFPRPTISLDSGAFCKIPAAKELSIAKARMILGSTALSRDIPSVRTMVRLALPAILTAAGRVRLFQGDAPAIEGGKGRAFGQTRVFHRAKSFSFRSRLSLA